jgi:hypothetical protein
MIMMVENKDCFEWSRHWLNIILSLGMLEFDLGQMQHLYVKHVACIYLVCAHNIILILNYEVAFWLYAYLTAQ